MNIQYPKGETLWVNYCDINGSTVFLLTSKEVRDYYYLYEAHEDGSVKKLGKARTPTELERKYAVEDKMRGKRKVLSKRCDKRLKTNDIYGIITKQIGRNQVTHG